MAKSRYEKYRKKSGKFVTPTTGQMELWLKRNGIEYKDFGDQFRVCNPDGDTKFNMEIHKTNAVVHDFRPNHQQYDGPFISMVAKYKGISYQEAINEVCEGKIVYGVADKIEAEVEEEVEDEIDLPSGCKSMRDKVDNKLWKMNLGYLINSRGLDEEMVYRANIHYLGTEIVIPYYEYGMLVFYQSRRQMDKVFKFPPVSVTKKKAGDFLYGFDDVEPHTEVIVMEAIYDALSGGSGCVATGGASLKDGQLNLLKILSPHTIILAADNDEAGRKAVKKDYLALNKMRKGDFARDIYYCLPPHSKDPDEQEDWNDMKRKGVDVKKWIHANKVKLNMKVVFEGVNGEQFRH